MRNWERKVIKEPRPKDMNQGGFTPLLWQIGVGDPINIKGPKGKFLLQEDGRRCLFVATGTGLAPFMSMIDTLRARGEQRDDLGVERIEVYERPAWAGVRGS